MARVKERQKLQLGCSGVEETFYRLDWLSFTLRNTAAEVDGLGNDMKVSDFVTFCNLIIDELELSEMLYADSDSVVEMHGRFGYVNSYEFKPLGVLMFTFPSENYSKEIRNKMGVLVQFSGKFFSVAYSFKPDSLCRKLNTTFEMMGFDNIRCTRIDVARDFINSEFNMDYINKFIDPDCPDGYFYTAGKKWTPTYDLKNKRVDCLYVGRRSGDKMLRFYDKLKESSKDGKIDVVDSNGSPVLSWLRYETEFHTKFSNNLFHSLLVMDDFDVFAWANKHDSYNNYVSSKSLSDLGKWDRAHGVTTGNIESLWKTKILYNGEARKIAKGVDFI